MAFPERWADGASKSDGVLVKQHDLVYETWCFKLWFNEGTTITNITLEAVELTRGTNLIQQL